MAKQNSSGSDPIRNALGKQIQSLLTAKLSEMLGSVSSGVNVYVTIPKTTSCSPLLEAIENYNSGVCTSAATPVTCAPYYSTPAYAMYGIPTVPYGGYPLQSMSPLHSVSGYPYANPVGAVPSGSASTMSPTANESVSVVSGNTGASRSTSAVSGASLKSRRSRKSSSDKSSSSSALSKPVKRVESIDEITPEDVSETVRSPLKAGTSFDDKAFLSSLAICYTGDRSSISLDHLMKCIHKFIVAGSSVASVRIALRCLFGSVKYATRIISRYEKSRGVESFGDEKVEARVLVRSGVPLSVGDYFDFVLGSGNVDFGSITPRAEGSTCGSFVSVTSAPLACGSCCVGAGCGGACGESVVADDVSAD